MVSEKLIIVLITIAILLSVVSAIVTISSINSKMIPEIKQNQNTEYVPSSQKAEIGIIVNKPAGAP
jgi:hypothetical protein